MKILTKQSQRIYDFVVQHPNEDIPAPTLNSIAAGENGIYVSSISKRVSEVRAHVRITGGGFVKSRDEWVNHQRRTWYRYVPPSTVMDKLQEAGM